MQVLLLGADEREGSTPVETCRVFAPLCSLLAGTPWTELSLLLCGPNCEGPPGAAVLVKPAVSGGGAGLRVRYSSSLYHDMSAAERGEPAHVAVAFQAGLWGYDSWGATVAAMLQQQPPCPLLVTSYNLAEAEDDEESLQQLAPAAKWRWAPTGNPWRSLENEREQRSGSGAGPQPSGAEARPPLFENGVWQCL